MKIAMIFDGLGTGGIERVGASYAQLLTEAGHQVEIINLKSDKNELLSLFPESCSYHTDHLGLAFQPDAFAALLKRRWGKYVYPIAYLCSRFLLCLKKTSSRLRFRKQYDVAIAFSGHLRDLSYVAYGLPKSCKKLAWAHGAIEDYLLLSYAFVFLYERIKNLCVLSTAGQEHALEYFPCLDATLNIHHIYNPIAQDPILVDPEKRNQVLKDWEMPVVCIGRFDMDKDQATVIRAFAILRDLYQSEPHLVFVGDGPTREACETLVQDLGLDQTIHFVGMQRDVDSYYLAARIVVHSSPAEGLPTVLLEAMRDGVPVLATNSLPGVPEILGNSESGLICRVGDSQDMAEKLHKLLTDVELCASYAEKGKQRARDFSPEAIGRQLADVMHSLK